MGISLFGKITIYSEDGFERRASVHLKPDGALDALEYRKELYTSSDEFREVHDYSVMVSSDENIRNALADCGFKVRDPQRINSPLHLMLPAWEISALDKLRRTEFINFSRSDLINKILLDNIHSIPPEYPYEKNMVKTTFTINPVAYAGIESLGISRTRNHIIYDYVTEFLERNPCI